jgi:hypothetical protein
MGAGPARVAAVAPSGPSPGPSQAAPRMPRRPTEGRVRRVGCPAGSLRGGPRPGGAAGDGPGCEPRRRRRRGRPRSRPAVGCVRRQCRRCHRRRCRDCRHLEHGARQGGWERSPRSGRGQRAASRQSRCGAATGRRPGARRQAESRERPLARRPARIARPARVRIRRRNPWVFARRRLFGWKVRLLTRGLPYDGLERRQRCLSQGGEPVATGPCRTSTTQRKRWTAWTRDSGRRDGSTGSRYVRSWRPVKPNRAGQRIAEPTANRPP